MLKISDEKEEMGLSELLNTVLDKKHLILAVTFVFSIIGFSYSFSRPKIWDGSVVLRIGQVGDKNLIIPLPTLLAKVQHPTFLSEILNSVHPANHEKSKNFNLLKESLRINMLDNYNVLEIKIRGYSQQATKTILTTLVHKISEYNSQIPIIAEQTALKNAIALSKLNIDHKQQIIVIKNLLKKNGDSTEEVIKSLDTLQRMNNELINIDTNPESTKLIALQTYPTSQVGNIYVSDEPSSPSQTRFTLLFAFLGLLTSIVFTILYSEFQRERKN